MATECIDSIRYYRMLQNGAAILEQNRKKINDLNVFPIPDGDTGDNMLMTINGGISETPAGDKRKIYETISRGMMYGARGNSGVILSRFFYGLNNFLSQRDDTFTVDDFIAGLSEGVREAYSAVSNPQEGTMLTVMREMYENVASKHFDIYDELFENLFYSAAESLKQTPEKLEVLKNAGVIDSGGAGFLCIIEGMKNEIEGKTDFFHSATDNGGKTPARDSMRLNDGDEMLGYCTEFILQTVKGKKEFVFDEFKHFMITNGDSVVCFANNDTVKVHVHTHNPGEILCYAIQFGEFITLKIENMTLQHSETTIKNDFIIPEKKKKSGVLQVASGDGIKEMLHDAGCDVTVDGGQSMNPSAKDIFDGIKAVGADTVYVFPNNGNVILSAEQAAGMCDFCNVIVIPTHDIGQGYTALSVFDADNKPEEQKKLFEETLDCSATMYVSKASRDCVSDGVNVVKDDYISFCAGKVLSCDENKNMCSEQACEVILNRHFDVALIICSDSDKKEQAETLAESLSAKYPDTEFIVTLGGQPIYDYIIIFN